MGRITHFDISADEPEKLKPFYETIFDWQFEKWDGPMDYWLITTGPDEKPGINGGLAKRQKDNYIMNTIEVENIDDTIIQIEELGGKIVSEKGPIPGVGYFATFNDPEGNLLGIMQPDEKAK